MKCRTQSQVEHPHWQHLTSSNRCFAFFFLSASLFTCLVKFTLNFQIRILLSFLIAVIPILRPETRGEEGCLLLWVPRGRGTMTGFPTGVWTGPGVSSTTWSNAATRGTHDTLKICLQTANEAVRWQSCQTWRGEGVNKRRWHVGVVSLEPRLRFSYTSCWVINCVSAAFPFGTKLRGIVFAIAEIKLSCQEFFPAVRVWYFFLSEKFTPRLKWSCQPQTNQNQRSWNGAFKYNYFFMNIAQQNSIKNLIIIHSSSVLACFWTQGHWRQLIPGLKT